MMHTASDPATLEARPLWRPGLAETGPAEPGPRFTQHLCDLIAIAAAAAFAMPVSELIAPTRRKRAAAFARQSAMYLAHTGLGLSYGAVGRAFGRDRTTAAHACRLVEDRRDDPALDAMLASLENACTALRRRLTAPVLP